jgi:uncharacterized protein
MISIRQLIRIVAAGSRLPATSVHGIAHWARVLENARRIAPRTGADPRVLELFAILHDSQRWSDGYDAEHGPRAAAFVRGLRADIDLDDESFAHLVEACDSHTRGAPFEAPMTVLTCLDADRLDIPRVGMQIRPDLLFTAAARDPEVLSWATERAVRMSLPSLLEAEWGWPFTSASADAKARPTEMP